MKTQALILALIALIGSAAPSLADALEGPTPPTVDPRYRRIRVVLLRSRDTTPLGVKLKPRKPLFWTNPSYASAQERAALIKEMEAEVEAPAPTRVRLLPRFGVRLPYFVREPRTYGLHLRPTHQFPPYPANPSPWTPLKFQSMVLALNLPKPRNP